MRSVLVPSVIVLLSACASSEVRDGFGNDGNQQNPDAPGQQNPDPSGNFNPNNQPPATSTPEVKCAADAVNKLYVVSAENVLYSFEPLTLKFTRVGIINCSTVAEDATGMGGTAKSMAVDRAGFAWLNLSNGDTYKVDTRTALCSSTGTTFKNTKYSVVNMGFSTVSGSPNTENLYVIGNGPSWTFFLGKIDPITLQPSTVGSLVGDITQKAELTGTGDGRLFGFFYGATPDKPMQLGEIKKDNAEVTKIVDIAGTAKGSAETAYAFSFWGGDFWFYHSVNGQPSKVIRYKYATDKTQEVVVQDVGGFRITGAGVSTCAPTTPPVVK